MSNPTPNFLPGDGEEPQEDLVTREVDGESELDPDANADLVDSAEADRLAAERDDDH